MIHLACNSLSVLLVVGSRYPYLSTDSEVGQANKCAKKQKNPFISAPISTRAILRRFLSSLYSYLSSHVLNLIDCNSIWQDLGDLVIRTLLRIPKPSRPNKGSRVSVLYHKVRIKSTDTGTLCRPRYPYFSSIWTNSGTPRNLAWGPGIRIFASTDTGTPVYNNYVLGLFGSYLL